MELQIDSKRRFSARSLMFMRRAFCELESKKRIGSVNCLCNEQCKLCTPKCIAFHSKYPFLASEFQISMYKNQCTLYTDIRLALPD